MASADGRSRGATGVPDRRPDIEEARHQLVDQGIEVTSIEHIEGLIRFCDFADPDGNQLSLYQAD